MGLLDPTASRGHPPLMHPVITANVTVIMVRDFGMSPPRAVEFTRQLIVSLKRRDLEIVRGAWMEGTATRDKFEWENLEALAQIEEMERNGIKPYNPPELQ